MPSTCTAGVGVDPHAQLGDDLAVHLDPALVDQVLAGAPAAQPGRGEHLLQPHAVRVVHVDRWAAARGSGSRVGWLGFVVPRSAAAGRRTLRAPPPDAAGPPLRGARARWTSAAGAPGPVAAAVCHC